ncbi:MAG: hypothetical protein HYU66_18215, partial [Armatimonadetes bacterium]|nr:hypothetical protein [Armatimonadota bacterium]
VEAAGVPDLLVALRLPGPERPGGRFELVDMRGLGKARMLPKAPDAGLAANAEVLASRLRRNLGDAGRWEFTEFASPDLAMVMQIRLEQVSGRTEYTASEPRRLTPDPGLYNVAEPLKPSPDARAYGLFGPKVYPQGDADPKYAKDVADWRDLHDAWERKKRDYYARRAAMDVEWQQAVVTSWSASVRASLELYQKDKLLASVPVDVTVRKRGEQTRKQQVRGFEDRPAPLVLPENRDNCPDALTDEALTAAAQQATGRVQLLALLPNDAGAPGSTTVSNPGSVGTVTAKAEGGAPIIVEADGIAAATVDPANREDVAKRDACRAAVEKAIGVYVESATRIEKSELMLDTVRTNATGWARVLEITRRQEDADGLRLGIRAEVQRRPMLKVLIENGLLRQWRLMVVVPDRDAGTSPAEDSLVHACLEAGFPVIDRAQSEQLRHNRELLDAIDNDPKAAMRLRTMSKAEILVTGRLAAEGAEEVAGQMACRARLAIKAIDLNTGEILAQESREAGATEATAEMARSSAATRCADMVADPLVDRILQRPQPAQGQARMEVTIKKVKSAGMAADIEEALAKLPGVKKVTELEFQRDVHLKLEVMVDQELAGKLAVQLERAEELKPFGILVDGKTTATIDCTASGAP